MNMSKKHALIMVACCLVPIVALAAIFLFKIPVSSVIYFGIVLLCPVLHLLMMGNMMKHDDSAHSHAGHEMRHSTPSQLTAAEKKD